MNISKILEELRGKGYVIEEHVPITGVSGLVHLFRIVVWSREKPLAVSVYDEITIEAVIDIAAKHVDVRKSQIIVYDKASPYILKLFKSSVKILAVKPGELVETVEKVLGRSKDGD